MSLKPLETLLTVNCGSSSLKFSLFSVAAQSRYKISGGADDGFLKLLYKGQISHIGGAGEFRVSDATGQALVQQKLTLADHEQALVRIIAWLKQQVPESKRVVIGHRVVHGGVRYHQPVRVCREVLDYLQTLAPLAPNHQPPNLQGIRLLQKLQPEVPQVACFDTAFHTTRAQVEQCFALPQTEIFNAVRRYGFHGLSYEYIASALPEYLGKLADGKIIVAHLGHGASLCAMQQRRSIATTMTFTPLDGIPMGTRSGSIDPSIVLYLLQHGMTAAQISKLLYFQSGLLGLSGVSDDVQHLLKQTDEASRFAIDYFEHAIVRAIGSLAATMEGMDALVFTAGIGEHASAIREAICNKLHWLGLQLDQQANQRGQSQISHEKSRIQAWVIPTDEERMIARHSLAILTKKHNTTGKNNDI